MNLKVLFKDKKAQVWVETVIYTLIGLTIIAIILAVATPAINRYKDQLIIEQTLTVMNNLDSVIKEVQDAGIGNKRIIPELTVKKGKIEIDANNEKITYILEKTRLMYSEPGSDIQRGNLKIRTDSTGNGKYYNIRIILDYSNQKIDLKNLLNSVETDNIKNLLPASVPYKISVAYTGIKDDTPLSPTSGDEKAKIVIEEI